MKYHLARGEEQLGTFNDLDVSSGLREGRFLPADLCWTEGMKDWVPLGKHMEQLATDTGVAPPELPAIRALREEVRQDQARRQALASLGQRLAAKIIDWVMLLIPIVMMFMALMDPAFEAEILKHQGDANALMEALQRQIGKVQEQGNVMVEVTGWTVIVITVINIVLLAVRGQSIGKMLLGIQVVAAADGAKAGFVKAVLLRWMIFAVIEGLRFIGPAIMLGNVLMIFRSDRRCMHDHVAGTMVVVRRQITSKG
ncbi:MAG: RDD family protein [Prosthecobacter sp.]|jgi:uncharacterized RDD family membrane protein YckC|uniref:RDD family protein n=1 Tax=Prosthecobacter sp. TaxID=1965333 RepID=UPI0019FE744F|nr:RDD family protein [Prosthecobacter sp.]MBE2284055.1 RDD family protein [Prosthecobacter sp.]